MCALKVSRRPATSRPHIRFLLEDPAAYRENIMTSSGGSETLSLQQQPAAAEMSTSTTSTSSAASSRARLPPKFTTQVPNLALPPGVEAFLDVEVESAAPVR